MPEIDIATKLQRGIRLLGIATVCLYLVTGASVLYVWHDSRAKRHDLALVANRTASALCALRADLEQRVTRSEAYLRDTPHAIPGITPTSVKAGITSQKRTIEALSNLKCAAFNRH